MKVCSRGVLDYTSYPMHLKKERKHISFCTDLCKNHTVIILSCFAMKM